MISGRPLVSSPPTSNQPRHAAPPFAIAIAAFSGSGRAKNSRGRDVERRELGGGNAVADDAEEPVLAARSVDLAGDVEAGSGVGAGQSADVDEREVIRHR